MCSHISARDCLCIFIKMQLWRRGTDASISSLSVTALLHSIESTCRFIQQYTSSPTLKKSEVISLFPCSTQFHKRCLLSGFLLCIIQCMQRLKHSAGKVKMPHSAKPNPKSLTIKVRKNTGIATTLSLKQITIYVIQLQDKNVTADNRMKTFPLKNEKA